MEEYTLDGMKYGRDPEFWKWLYTGDCKRDFLLCNPKRTQENYIDKLKNDLSELSRAENLEWANKKNDTDQWIIKHSKDSLLAQIEGLKKVIVELKSEESK